MKVDSIAVRAIFLPVFSAVVLAWTSNPGRRRIPCGKAIRTKPLRDLNEPVTRFEPRSRGLVFPGQSFYGW